jgi:hypothetical protein
LCLSLFNPRIIIYFVGFRSAENNEPFSRLKFFCLISFAVKFEIYLNLFSRWVKMKKRLKEDIVLFTKIR